MMLVRQSGCTRFLSVVLLVLSLSLVTLAHAPRVLAATMTDATQLVNPFIGTTNSGYVFPGADAPFGMVQFSPDTVAGTQGGYNHGDNRLRGFSLTHISGAGCYAFGDIPFLPYVGAVTTSPATNASTYQPTFSHANETAYAGYYKVGLDDGVTTELTTSQHTGGARFTYPTGTTASLLVNVAGSANGAANAQVTLGTNTIAGFVTSGSFCGKSGSYTLYFWATFSQPFASVGTWQNGTLAPNSTSASGTGTGGYVTFATPSVEMAVGVSYVSLANAQANVTQENPSGSFATLLTGAGQAWNSRLGAIAATGGTPDQETTFYTALYHALLFPSVFSDANGQYMGFDQQVHTVAAGHAQYANYSGWDIYRSEAPLLGFLAPHEAGDMAQSMINDYQQGGHLPKWTLADFESYIMVGDPADAILASFYAFGGTDFDTHAALTAMVNQATQTNTSRPGLNYLQTLGYLPTDGSYGCCNFYGPAATTLEYNTADFAIGAFAHAIGDTSTYATFTNRAQDWQNLLNPTNKDLEPRTTTGAFSPSYSPTSTSGWVEGDGAQYNWLVPFNLGGLFASEGGASAIVPRLDTFFTQLNANSSSPYAWLGNEPSLESPWEYDYAGAPYRTQAVIRQAQNTLYTNTTGGIPGNDDLGEMSSWYVWSALGMYPEVPGTANLVLAAPLFPSITITRPTGQTIAINAPTASATTYYVQGLKLNGAATSKPWLSPTFISTGGTLDYTLGTTANTSWGANAADAPPSYGTVSAAFSTGFENRDVQPTWTSAVDASGPPAGGSTNITGVCCQVPGPEAGTRTEQAHTGTTALMYSGLAQGQAKEYAYMKVLDFSSAPLVVGGTTTLSYWIYPQSTRSNPHVQGSNSTCVALDLIFTDGTNLRDSGAKDQHGNRAHPAYQCQRLTLDTWNQVTVALGGVANGKTILRLDLGYDQPNSSGGYRGYVDDIAIG